MDDGFVVPKEGLAREELDGDLVELKPVVGYGRNGDAAVGREGDGVGLGGKEELGMEGRGGHGRLGFPEVEGAEEGFGALGGGCCYFRFHGM